MRYRQITKDDILYSPPVKETCKIMDLLKIYCWSQVLIETKVVVQILYLQIKRT